MLKGYLTKQKGIVQSDEIINKQRELNEQKGVEDNEKIITEGTDSHN
jgi:hypothetical protein